MPPAVEGVLAVRNVFFAPFSVANMANEDVLMTEVVGQLYRMSAKDRTLRHLAGSGTCTAEMNITRAPQRAQAACLGFARGVASNSKGEIFYGASSGNVVVQVNSTTNMLWAFAGQGTGDWGSRAIASDFTTPRPDGVPATSIWLDYRKSCNC